MTIYNIYKTNQTTIKQGRQTMLLTSRLQEYNEGEKENLAIEAGI